MVPTLIKKLARWVLQDELAGLEDDVRYLRRAYQKAEADRSEQAHQRQRLARVVDRMQYFSARADAALTRGRLDNEGQAAARMAIVMTRECHTPSHPPGGPGFGIVPVWARWGLPKELFK